MIRMKCFGVLATGLLITGMTGINAWADDLDDDISKYKDDSIQSDDDLGKPDTNISFIVSDAIGDAKVHEYEEKKEKMAEGIEQTQKDAKREEAKSQKSKHGKGNINLNDGSGDSNENSIVIGAGSKVDKVINVIIGK